MPAVLDACAAVDDDSSDDEASLVSASELPDAGGGVGVTVVYCVCVTTTTGGGVSGVEGSPTEVDDDNTFD